jgi:predicted TPR repeat methyltransferase
MTRPSAEDDWRAAAASVQIDASQFCHTASLLLAAHRLTVLGRTRAAETVYAEVLRREPDHRESMQRLLAVLRSRGRRDEADALHRLLILAELNQLDLPPEERDQLLGYQLAVAGLGPTPERLPAEYLARSFDAYADRFESHLRENLHYRGPEIALEVLSRVLSGCAGPTLDVLDLGCGTGLAGPLLRPLCRRLDGIDLSAAMLDKARARGIYDDLAVGDLTELPARRPDAYDLVFALEVLIYLGDLRPVFRSVSLTLRPGGLFAFTVESGDGTSYALQPNGRYSHPAGYIEKVATSEGFEESLGVEASLRQEQGRDVPSRVAVFRKSSQTGQEDPGPA